MSPNTGNLLFCSVRFTPSISDRVRDIPAGPAHGQRGEDDSQPARGIALAHPGLRGDSDSGRARRDRGGHAALEHRPRHGNGPRGKGKRGVQNVPHFNTFAPSTCCLVKVGPFGQALKFTFSRWSTGCSTVLTRAPSLLSPCWRAISGDLSACVTKRRCAEHSRTAGFFR